MKERERKKRIKEKARSKDDNFAVISSPFRNEKRRVEEDKKKLEL